MQLFNFSPKIAINSFVYTVSPSPPHCHSHPCILVINKTHIATLHSAHKHFRTTNIHIGSPTTSPMVKRSRPNSEDSEAASSSAAFPHKKKQKSTGAWPGWSRMFEWFGLKRPSTSTSTSTTMPAAEDDVVVVKVVEQVIIDDDDEEEEAPIVVESEDDDETEVDEPKPGDETEPFVPECDHATTPQSTRELTPPLSPEDMARWQRLKEDSTASIAGACTPPLLDENIYPTTGDELEIPNSPTMIYPSATDKLLETPTSDAASSRPPLADDDDAVVFSLSTEFEVLAASSPPLGAVDVTTELLPSPQSAPPSPAQNGSAMPATPPSRPGSQSLQPDSPPSPQIATPTSPSDEIVKFKSIYELHPSLRAPPKTATLRHTSVAPRVNKFRKSIIRPMSKQHAEQNFLKMMRDQMPETWADCARWPAPKSESARNPSFISARPATNGIKRREVMLRIQANIKKGKEVRDFLRPKIERYWRRQGKQLPQKPETPSYEKLLAKQQELDQEVRAATGCACGSGYQGIDVSYGVSFFFCVSSRLLSRTSGQKKSKLESSRN
ncbi:hypothetical protein DFJ77DRAFT_304873 [Powellomyces hirtus]|nr:hypothetical protein DFJ77DRAFT_304873 [Powellomyces hirtus]